MIILLASVIDNSACDWHWVVLLRDPRNQVLESQCHRNEYWTREKENRWSLLEIACIQGSQQEECHFVGRHSLVADIFWGPWKTEILVQAGFKLLFLGKQFLLFLFKQPILPEDLFFLLCSLSKKEVFVSKHMDTLHPSLLPATVQEVSLSHFPYTASVCLPLLASRLYFSGISLY